MTLAIILLLLRIISALVLMSMMIVFIVFVWRDYNSAATQAEISRRVYGQLVSLMRVEEMFMPTGEVYPLRPLTSMGRSPTNSIVIPDNFASSEHALISLKEGRWWLEDRNSRNGTMLNGEPIHSPIIITDGDIISIGNTHLKLTFDN